MRTYLAIICFALFVGTVSSRSLYSNSEDDDTNDLINQDGDNSNDDKSELPDYVQQSIDRISNDVNWSDNNADDREILLEDDSVPNLPVETNGINVSKTSNEQYNRHDDDNSDDNDDSNSKDNFDDTE
ncbi:unnamed protein product [Adineta ricciae]|uniref:Secreted protein n=1 Tax=Adineta ricciae TaxID=249248 RepID=A0A813SXL9_ADIRI|nr:unnamed protein product [Adineta ricciae]CAF1229351.1 unnamed protein product [Adineta ricciae]